MALKKRQNLFQNLVKLKLISAATLISKLKCLKLYFLNSVVFSVKTQMKQTYSCKVFLGYHRISYSSLFRVSLGCCVLLFKFSEGPTHQGPGFRDFLRSHQVPARIPGHSFPDFLGYHQGLGSPFFGFSRVPIGFWVPLVSHQGPVCQFYSMPKNKKCFEAFLFKLCYNFHK